MNYPTHPTDSTSSSLLGRARTGENAAWQQLVTLYGPLVWKWCGERGVSTDDIADVFQNVFARVHCGLPSFRREAAGQTFRGWLRTIARNAIIDHHRSAAKTVTGRGGSVALTQIKELVDPHPSLDLQSPDDGDQPAASSPTENLLVLRQAMTLLKPQFSENVWQAFLRTARDGLSAPDVAAELAMTPDAVRQAKRRVLQKLRQEFGDLIDITPPRSASM